MQAVKSSQDIQLGVVKNPHGGYHIHLKLNERQASPLVGGGVNLKELAPVDTPTLSEMEVFEDCVLFNLQGGQSLIIHASDPEAVGSVVLFYHANGTLWRVAPLEKLNPGWVLSSYIFRGDMGKFEARLSRMQSRKGITPRRKKVTFWQSGEWPGAIVRTATGLVYRLKSWQHSELPEPEVEIATAEQVETLGNTRPADVQQIIALQREGVEKQTYQVGGLRLILKYLDQVGLMEIVSQYCPRRPKEDGVSDGEAIAALVINRMLSPCALRNVATWVEQTGLHLLLGVADPQKFNYDRLVDALLAVNPHWQEIAAQITLRAVEAFGLKVETVHYDLTSILFYGDYKGSAWVDYGYSRDHRPDRPQLNIGLSATDDGEVVLPGGSNLHAGNTNDGATTVGAHQQLWALFQRSDLLVTGDRIMQSALNMLLIARAHGRFLGPVVWTATIRGIVAAIDESEFEPLPLSSQKAGREIKGVFRQLPFKVEEELSPQGRERMKRWRMKRRLPGPTPKKRTTHFWMRAVIILDPERQKSAAASRQKRLQLYQTELDWVQDHLNKGKYYGDPDWVAGKLSDLAAQFKDVRDFVKVTFSQKKETMTLSYQLRPAKIAQAAPLDGRWMLVTNQPPETGQSTLDYLDWMVSVYKNHRHIERRMRNLKSDLPIRPLYAHRDAVIVPLCFVCVLALMLYTLVERDCQANPALVEVGLTTTDQLLAALAGHCLTVFYTPSGYQVFWFDTPTETQTLIWAQFELPNPGHSAPIVCLIGQSRATRPVFCFSSSNRGIGAGKTSVLLLILVQNGGSERKSSLFSPSLPFPGRGRIAQIPILPFFAIVKVLNVMLC
ncbi:MAG: IS1634 family transposase [Planctomycetota bacterium]|jgi:transposase